MVCPVRLPIFSFVFVEPRLDAEIYPGMALTPFPCSIWKRRDSNPRPFDCETSLLITLNFLMFRLFLLEFFSGENVEGHDNEGYWQAFIRNGTSGVAELPFSFGDKPWRDR